MSIIRVQIAFALVLLAGTCGPAGAASPAPSQAGNGMVVTAQHLASDVGASVLEAGGNAVDAAVAGGFAPAGGLSLFGQFRGGGVPPPPPPPGGGKGF